MNLVEDFRQGPPPARAVADGLLDCFQEALGHQLPNHFVALQGLARLLQETEGPRLSAEGREYLGRLATLAGQSARLVRALAELGRLCRDAHTGGPVSPAEVAREAAAEVQASDGAAAITYDFPPDLPAARVSRPPLTQALVQLLRNAVRAAKGGVARVRLGGRAVPGGAEVWVADDGPGLPPLTPGQLFAPFRPGPREGLGLGLFLVRQLVARWGGRLRVESRPGAGACFTLFLPAADGPLGGPVAP
jgi:signal transduction histidine kinase